MIGRHQAFVRANFRCVPKDTSQSAAPGIAQQWPTLLMIKLGRITMHRFTEALELFGIRPRHVAALIELRDSGELTQQSLCGALHLDPTNLVAILNDLEQRGYATRRRAPPPPGSSGPTPPAGAPPPPAAATSWRYRRRASP